MYKLEHDDLKVLINECDTKTNGELDIQKIQKYLDDKLKPLDIPFSSFYNSLIEDFPNLLKDINNSIQKENFFVNNNELVYFYKTLDIFFCISHCCITLQILEIVKDNFISDSMEKFINIFFKIVSIEENNKNQNNAEIDNFCQYINDAIKILLDINPFYIFQYIFIESKDLFSFLLKQFFTRQTLYEVLEKIISKDNKVEFLKGKEYLIKELLNYLINESNAGNVPIIIKDIKHVAKIFRNDITLVFVEFMELIKKIIKLYRNDLKNEYENLFVFFFNEIVFEENINEKDKKKGRYNKEFLNFLFELYKYLISNKIKNIYDIFLIKLFDSINYNNNDNRKGNAKGNGTKKYEWLLDHTEYNKIVLDTFPEVFDKNSFTFYLGILMTLSSEDKIEEKKKTDLLLELDLFLFFKNFQKYLNNPSFKKDDLIDFFTNKIGNLMNNNIKIIRIILGKCKPFNFIINIIESENDTNVKNKLFDFIEKMLSLNKEQYECEINIDIRTKINDLNLKINLLSVGYEVDDNKYNEKLSKLLDIMNTCCIQKKINDFLRIVNLIFKIIIDYKFKKINIISDNIILHLNNLLLQISSIFCNSQKNELADSDKKLEELIFNFLNTIYKFIFQLNMKKFEYKAYRLNEKPQIYYTKRIIEKKILKEIIKNMLLAKNNPVVKKKTFEYLMNFSVDEKNNIILSSYILYIIINIYYQDKNYKNLQKMFNILLNLIKTLELNAKILLNFDFVLITINILQEIYVKESKDKDEEECYKTGFAFLEEISQYLTQELLMKYLNQIFIIFNKDVLSQMGEQPKTENELSEGPKRNNVEEPVDLYGNNSSGIASINSRDNGRENIGLKHMDDFELENDLPEDNINNNNEEEINNENNENEIDNKPKICLDFFNILKKYLKLNLKNNNNFINNNTTNYVILSNYTFPNHLINNLLFVDDLKYRSYKDKNVSFRIVLKINTYNGMSDFILLQLRSGKIKIIFLIHKNSLIIREESSDHQITLGRVDNFYKELPDDNKYHNIFICFDTDKKCLDMTIDNKVIISKSNQYQHFQFESFNMLIGFKNSKIDCETNNINSKLSKNKNDMNIKKDPICLIYISYLLVLNTLLIKNEDLEKSILKERNYYTNGNILSHFYRNRNSNWAKNVILEIDFQNKNFNLAYSKDIKNKVKEINNYYLTDKQFYINQYISYIDASNSFNDEVRSTCLYMISQNKNINEYYSLNNFCELERLNKSKISSKIFDNYDLIFSFCNIYIIDFLIGFLFLIEKRIYELKNKDKENEENNNNEDEDICMTLYGNTFIVNEDITIEYIIEIFEIILLIPSENLKNYFINGDSKSNILKIKYFFYRNISLLNYYNRSLIEKLLKLFSLEKDDNQNLNEKLILLEILIIFLDIKIFGKLDFSIQNKLLLFLNDLLNKKDFLKKVSQNNSQYSLDLIKSLIRIVIYNKIKLIENINGKNQIEIIVDCINIILSQTYPSEDRVYEEILKITFRKIYKICLNFSNDIKIHLNNELYPKFNSIFSDSNEEDDDYEENIDKKIDKLSENIKNFFDLIKKNKYFEIFLKGFSDSKECAFCDYLKDLFYLEYNFIYDELKYEKIYKKFFRNYYLNFGENSEIFGNKRYIWNLSLKESYAKIQNKLFIKENNIKCFSYQHPKTKKIINHFIYDYGKERYKKTFKELRQLVYIEQICRHKSLIVSLYSNKKIFFLSNCLIINKLHKILSTIILYEDFILLFYNICIDSNNNNKINVVFSDTTHALWTKSKKDFEKEFTEYIRKNEEDIKKEIYENKSEKEDKKKQINEFYYNKCYKFSRRFIFLKKINEIHKRNHLHIPNSLELFLDNGESYFIVLTPENREILFDKIITNINDIYKFKENKLEVFKHSKIINSNNKDFIFYMKHFPVLAFYQSQEAETFLKNQKKNKNLPNNFDNYKLLLDGNIVKDEICYGWSKNKITNYDYLMLLNTIAGRSLNDLSQYFIFPWIIKDFNKEILNWLSDKIYRDLSLPIHACGEDKDRIINKYELLDDEKYHSGTFYSTHSFVCYFLVRQRPFTEIHLEIQGSKFDAPARMFNGVEQLSNLNEKYQELIPALFNFPELFIKTNYIFDESENKQEPINDFELPNWSKNDPRKFALILKKLLESERISNKLNCWIDLIFGYKQTGTYAIKALNIFRNACYTFTKSEFEKIEKNNELETYMYEKEELGCVGRQLFTKPHKYREINSEHYKIKKIFFNNSEKLTKLVIHKVKNHFLDKIIKEKINNQNNSFLNAINDIIFFLNSPLNDNNKNIYYQGGISSLPSVMNSLREKNVKNSNINNKFVEMLQQEENFFLLNKKFRYLKKLRLFLNYNNKCIELINIIDKSAYWYFLNEIGDISCLTTNEKGTKLFICFSDGTINEYKIKSKSKKEKINDPDYIFPLQLSHENFIYKDIYYNESIFKNFVNSPDILNTRIYLKKINKNNFIHNNPHIPKKINLISLNEHHNVLIALDESNLFYILSLNNNYKLMHISHFLSNTHYKMKEIIPLHWNGDFIIYSSYTIYLFSINGIPLCQLNLFEKMNEIYSRITCCRAVFLYDIILFTTHKDGSVIIWKIINKNVTEKFDERISYVFNRKKSKFFLPEYTYGYNSKHNRFNESKIREYELQRRFEIVGKINYREEPKTYFNFMKMSYDLDYMILFDNKKNLYVLTNKDDDSSKKSSHKNKKDRCYNCNKKLIDEGIRPTLIMTNTFAGSLDINSFEIVNHEDENNTGDKLICEECKQKLEHTENYLYNF